MQLAEALSGKVRSAVRERGRDYFRSGFVKLEAVDAEFVAATVRGSEKYDVELYLDGRDIFASCTCPYIADRGEPCKHIWATVLAAEPRGFAGSEAAAGSLNLVVDDDLDAADDYFDDEYYDDPPPPRGIWRPPASRQPRRESWREQLESLRREAQPDDAGSRRRRPSEVQLLYVIDADESTRARKLCLDIHQQQRKKNGEWSKPKFQHFSATDFDTIEEPLDRQLLALLQGAQGGDSSGYGYYGYGQGQSRYRVGGLLLDTVLPLLIQSGRLFLRRDPNTRDLAPLTPDLDPPWQLVVTIARAGGAKAPWAVVGSLRRGEEALPIAAPALIVPGLVVWDDRLGRLDDGGAYAWVPTLRRGVISIPSGKSDELMSLLLEMPSLPRLDLPEELRWEEERTAPRPSLTVTPPKYAYGRRLLNLRLSFNYGGAVVPAEPFRRGVFQRESRKLILRDRAAEEAAARELSDRGAKRGYDDGGVLQLAPNQLPKLVRDLVLAGWHVHAEGKLYRRPGEFKLGLSSGQDWFDLTATADFEGHAVALPKLLEALQRGESSVVLDDGTVGMVPEEWLKKFGLLLRMGAVKGDAVRFGRAQVGVLDALLASRPEIAFDQQFATAREELRRFEGIEPADAPREFVGELREYQREGLGWLRFLRRFGFGGCLADDMGLGKTVQILALLAGKRDGPALVVVPKSLVFNWKQEIARFTPGLKVLDHTGTGRDRTGAAFKDHDVVLTTYGTLRNDAATFSEFRFDACVLDESQAAKNAETETAKAVKLVQADHRLALSGTPVENHLGELWTLFDFLNPGMLGRSALFAGSMRNPDAETREILARALRPFLLRRTKNQVAKDLPAKTEQTIYCDLEPGQRKLYNELRDHYRQALLSRIDAVGLAKSKLQVLEALLRLRQAACHPGLIDKGRVNETSAKLDVLLPQLEELAEEGHKALVFSQFTSLLAIVRKRLDAAGVSYEYLDGKTRDRAARVERFQNDSNCRLFLISLKAGGVGLNLTAAEYVFLLDPWWNPAVEAQAIDRSHRIGQTRPVFAYRLIARETVEEKVLALQQAKRELADAILGGDGRMLGDLKREDLELLLS